MDEGVKDAVVLGIGLGSSGLLLQIVTEYFFPRQSPAFNDFQDLRRRLTNSQTKRASITVEGTIEKLDDNSLRSEKGGAKGVARRVTTTHPGRRPITNVNISVPFKLVDPQGSSIRVVHVHNALRVHLVMQKVWDEPVQPGSSTPGTSELLLMFGTQLGACGEVVLEGNEITLTPSEVDPSISHLQWNRRVIRRLLYFASYALIGGGAVSIGYGCFKLVFL